MGLFAAKASLHTRMGWLNIVVEDDAITEVLFAEQPVENTIVSNTLVDAVRELEEYFEGKRSAFTIVLNPRGTEFQKKVWNELMNIPFGKTISYHELADRLGDEKSIRAAASANGKNPIAVIIPCHRVIGTDGSLTGYAGGIERKSFLLNLEKGVYTPTLFEDNLNLKPNE
jgi:methylated-DNA-[protein]-cysteine S-methyltransferase